MRHDWSSRAANMRIEHPTIEAAAARNCSSAGNGRFFDGDPSRLTGKLLPVKIKESSGFTLYGDAALAI